MKLLFDQNISFRIERKLNINFEFSKHVSSVGLKDADDIQIWNYAKKESFVIVTFDADFYDISMINGCPPKIIWLRNGNLTTNQVIDILNDKLLIIRNFIENQDKREIACLELNN